MDSHGASMHAAEVFISDEHNTDQAEKQRRMQKKYREALLNQLPLPVQKILPCLHNVLLCVTDDELFTTMDVSSLDDESFKKSLQECTTVVQKLSTNRYHVFVAAKWTMSHVSRSTRKSFECYVLWSSADADLFLR